MTLSNPQVMYLGIELLFTALFITDQLLRIIATNIKKGLKISYLSIVDTICNVISIFVILVWFSLSYLPMILENLNIFCHSLRLLRIIRHSRGLMMIICTLQVRIMDISFIISILFILIITFGSAIFISEYATSDIEHSYINSLPKSFYMVGTIITTVGYSDHKKPTSSLSWFFVTLACISSIIIMFLPIPLLARSFYLYYNVAKVKAFELATPLERRLFEKRKRIFAM